MNNLIIQDFELSNPITDESWNERLLSYEDYSFFHTREWCQTLAETYNFKPFYLIENTDNDRIIYPFMGVKNMMGLKKLVSLPFTDYCNPLSDHEILLDKKVSLFTSLLKKIKYTKINFNTCTIANDNLITVKNGVVQKINLITPTELYKTFDHTTRGNISKAERKGVEIKIDNSLEGLNEFYSLQCICRKRHNLPPQPIIFFKALYNSVFDQEMGDIFLAYYKSKIIASGLFLKFNKKVIFKYANSIYDYQNIRPSNLLTWESMKYYFDLGYKIFDFGKTESENDGLYRYKKGYNAYEIPLFHYVFKLKENNFKSIHTNVNLWAKYIFKYAPISHLKIVGNIIYKYFP